MTLYLHNPASDAHLHDLQDRLRSHLASGHSSALEDGQDKERVERLLSVVRRMDRGELSPKEAIETFTRHGFPSFSKWLVDMLDEGVYVDSRFSRAA